MRITSVEPFIVRVPIEGREGPTTGDWTIVLVHTDAGLTGIGRGGSVEIISQELAPVLVGQDPRRTALLWERMYETAWRFGGPGDAAMVSIGALDVALWDIYGKACGEPVWRLLGGYRDRVPAYADGSGYVAEVDQSPEAVAALVKKHADLGYDAMKIHMYEAKSPDEIVETGALYAGIDWYGAEVDGRSAPWLGRKNGGGDRSAARTLQSLLDRGAGARR